MNLASRNVVLLVVAGGLAVPTFMQWRADTETFVDLATVPLLFDGFTSDNVAQIVLGQPKKDQPPQDPNNPQQPRVSYDQIAFARTDKGWVLASGELKDAPVSKDRIEGDVFHHLRSIRADREVLVQPNATPEQLAAYGLDEAQAFVIRAADATPLRPTVIAELLVGKQAGQGQTGTEAVNGVFVRRSDSNDVVLYEFERPWRRDVTQDQWIERVLAKLEPDKIRRLSLRNTATAGVTFTFERQPGKSTWQTVDAPPGLGALRQNEVENIVQRLRWIGVQEYRGPRDKITNPTGLGLTPPQIEIGLTVRDNDAERVLTLEVGHQVDGKNEYYLICNESKFLMTWPAGTVTPFELDVKTQMFDPPPVPPEAPKEAAPKEEPPKQEAPKEEAPPKQEAPKEEAPKETPAPQEPPKQEVPKAQPPKEEAAQQPPK